MLPRKYLRLRSSAVRAQGALRHFHAARPAATKPIRTREKDRLGRSGEDKVAGKAEKDRLGIG